ncbi:MAG: carbon-nitrogen hydrolase [Salinisphaera sp.]|nr:carbon-nitrogen hydrolase [Salinisphaera sp.]
MTDKTLQVALVQHACAEDIGENLARAVAAVHKVAAQGARLVVLPELHNHRYFCWREDLRAFDAAETIPGPSTRALGDAARTAGVVVVGSLFERRAAGVFHNTAVVLDADGTLAGRYRKMHIPDDPGYHEKFYFTPGDQGFAPIKTSIGKLGVLVCWDQWFPEAARLMALAGAQCLIYPSAIGWDPADDTEEQQRQRSAWQTVQRGHAVANHLPVLTTNRVGMEDAGDSATHFWGGSFAAGAQGELFAEAGEDEAIVLATIEPARTERLRRIWPFLRDRRIDAYGELTRRYRD